MSPSSIPKPRSAGVAVESADGPAAAEQALAAALTGGTPPAGETRERILDLAQDLLLRRSFNSFSYQDLADAIGIRKASIHYYFPSKEDLGVALVERIAAGMGRWARQLKSERVCPAERLAAYFRVSRRLLEAGEKICVYGVLGAEFNALPERVRAAYSELLEGQQRWLARVLERGRESGAFAFAGSAEQQALLLAAAVQGGLQIARASGCPERFDSVVAALSAGLRVTPAAGG